MSWLIFAVLCATAQHSLYASVFYSLRMRILLATHHSAFINFAYSLRLVTILFGVAHVFTKYGFPNLSNLASVPFYGLGLIVFAFGFHLNHVVYQKLDLTMMYYGAELGVKKLTKWITEYPYSTFSHPQYIGCVLQLVGAAMTTGFDSEYVPRWDILIAVAYMSSLYYVTVQVEKRKF
ncbi:hypothetical protein HK100_001835 [Physocladia obscura]|uniref:phosphatidyl-N-methylethanolamine N-methyltransferase n=1 Tax=Physocladia obscura TaxID=109957 RepID=A0AAD5SYT3_9FUNG|nr:hypothetical protein HK100_001835 [Physocladia obscura]